MLHLASEARTLRDNLALEDPKHFIMQCVYLMEERCRMFADIENMERDIGQAIIRRSDNMLWTILDGPVDGVRLSNMIKFCSIVATKTESG